MNSRNLRKAKSRKSGSGSYVEIRLSPALMREIERWAKRNGRLSRANALSRLVRQGLSIAAPAKSAGKKATAKAVDLAAREIDRRGDPLTTAKERARRKRRLLKGPVEFRIIRKRQQGAN